MRHKPIKSKLFSENRKRVAGLMGAKALAVPAGTTSPWLVMKLPLRRGSGTGISHSITDPVACASAGRIDTTDAAPTAPSSNARRRVGESPRPAGPSSGLWSSMPLRLAHGAFHITNAPHRDCFATGRRIEATAHRARDWLSRAA